MTRHNTPGGVCKRCGVALSDVAPGFAYINCTTCGFVADTPNYLSAKLAELARDTHSILNSSGYDEDAMREVLYLAEIVQALVEIVSVLAANALPRPTPEGAP
jgi:hypothetical protein